MGSSLGPVLVYITVTEWEEIVVSNLNNSVLIKFYIRYADDIDNTVYRFNTFDNHLKFTIINLTGNNVDSLYIKTERDETDLF